jgi:hypothetical protein
MDQVPLEVAVLSSIVALTQTTPRPVIAAGSGLKETVCVVLHPVDVAV